MTRNAFSSAALDAGAMPMACWLGRSFVLLPKDIVNWPGDLQRTVLAHELGHVARQDAWSDLLIQVVWRILWFHPLMWLARSLAPRLRERACDEWVIASGRIESRDYANHLLNVVSRCAKSENALIPAMARGRDLESRVRSIVRMRTTSWSRKPLAKIATVLICCLATVVLAGGRLIPAAADVTQQEPVKNSMPTKGAVEPVAVDAPAITLNGVVVTPEGKAIPRVTVILRIEDPFYYSGGVPHGRETLAEMNTDEEGRFQFEKIGIPLRHEQQINHLLANDGGT